MDKFHGWLYPDIPEHIANLIFDNDHHLIIVGVIGKSVTKDCNKLAAFNMFDRPVCTINHTPKEGQIQFFYKPTESMLILHFETTQDGDLMEEMLVQEMVTGECKDFFEFHHRIRSRFARTLLFVLHVCHVCVYVDVGFNVDTTLMDTLGILQYVRECHVKNFLPNILNQANIDEDLVQNFGRLCTPRLLFLFENYPVDYEKTKDAITKLEFDTEDQIYSILRDEEIVGNNSSLVSIPRNKQFVYFNTDEKLRADLVVESQNFLIKTLETAKSKQRNHVESIESLAPFKGIGKPYYTTEYNEEGEECCINEYDQAMDEMFFEEHNFMTFLLQHVNEALTTSFDDHIQLPSVKKWYELFKIMHKIIIEDPNNPDFETVDAEYNLYLKVFDTVLNGDLSFFMTCCANGVKRGYAKYKQLATSFYNRAVHYNYMEASLEVYNVYARGSCYDEMQIKLLDMCEAYWENGRQACDEMSLRGNHCMQPKDIEHNSKQHISGQIFVATCNCGRTQGHRDDPYSIREANYEYYECLARMCSHCAKVKGIPFKIFQPSSREYRAAAFDIAFPVLKPSTAVENNSYTSLMDSELEDHEICDSSECSQPLSVSFGTNFSLSQETFEDPIEVMENSHVDTSEDVESDSESFNENELVLQLKDKLLMDESSLNESCDLNANDFAASLIQRQASTTEYLPGLVHTLSVKGLLPLFPSWSLVCVGSSSVYSHSSGLMEHFQTGFLSGSNFLLPWDVHVRLQRGPAETNVMGKPRRFRKKGDLIVLKVFVGFEYECARGHRFFLSSPNKVLRGSTNIGRDSGSQVVNNDMPLYYPCPCHSHLSELSQLMRVHVVTPKAPVNVIVDPRVLTGEQDFIFTLGQETPPRLSQSAYWILRLPYVYQGDDVIIMPPSKVTASNAMDYGCLLAGMFGVAETADDNEEEAMFFKK